MPNVLRVPYTLTSATIGEVGWRPYLPLTLGRNNSTVTADALIDSGAAVNVLPYRQGLALGAQWHDQIVSMHLGGNLAQYPARVLILDVTVGQFPTVPLAFAWTQAENVPLILGQVNFLMEFDVCFFRSQKSFEVQPKQ